MNTGGPARPQSGVHDLEHMSADLPAAIAFVDSEDASVSYANAMFKELLGLEPQANVPPITSLFVDSERLTDLLRTAAGGARVVDAELEAHRNVGDDLKVLASIAASEVAANPGSVALVLREISDDHELRNELAERSKDLEQLARFPEMNPGPVLRLDREGTVLLANSAARDLFCQDVLVGESWLDLCPEMDRGRWDQVVGGGEELSLEVDIADRSIVFAHVADASGDVFFVFGADVTEARETHRLLAEASNDLEELARFPDMNPGPVLQMDSDATVLRANRASVEVFGSTVVGASWRDICPDFDEAVWDAVMDSENFVTLDRRLDGKHFVFYHRRDALSGRVFLYGADVTDLRRADELIHLLLASTGEGIYGIDPKGVCTFANPASAAILGYESENDLLGQDMHALSHHSLANGEAYPRTECRIYKALSEDRGIHADDEVMWRADGSSFPVEYWSYPMRVDGERVGAVVTFVDITERQLVADELARARVKAEEASEAKSQFMANMSHELRTPMNAILGYSEMLMEDAQHDGNEDAVGDLSKINSAGRHLLDLINTILDLSKIEAGQMDVNLETFDVAAMLSDVAAVTQPLIEKNGNTLVKDWDDSLGEMNCDVTKVRQSLLNLLSNASKFSQNDDVTFQASRETVAGKDWIVFRVIDNGIGIPADKLEHVFEEFAQASSTTARDYGGTGLGLPVTKRLCRLLGGDVTLESTVGEGSTFTIELPADGPPVEVCADGSTVVSTDRGGSRPDVLVIDDDAHSRDLLARTLERHQYSVLTTSSGARGVELALSEQPSLITLDIIMPDMDGWAVLAALKENPETAGIPVVMVSISTDKERGFLLGAVESLSKPIDRDVLYDVARQYLAGDTFRVLVVDDDQPSRSLLRRFVEAARWECAEADSGLTALGEIEQQQPDLILLDLMMPDMNGFELIDELRSSAEHRSIPIVVITAKNLTEEDHARLRGRVEAVVAKGQQSADEVLEYVRSLLAEAG